MSTPFPKILPRDLTTDNKLNLIFGIFAVTVGTLSCLLAWATWKLAYTRRAKREDHRDVGLDEQEGFGQQQAVLQVGRGYELTLRVGRGA
ncbi:hypothetical protein BGZ60DRAFT_423587 [Tricladium varicosporioides]|nr:hypothetical protein BGZ60DRAFT_423587 [Hymenoscyphus varicosporioides]